jgi:hypothetical protein
MALTLSAGISASDRYCTVNQPPSQPSGSYYRIGNEVIQHIGYVTTTPIWSPTFSQLYIARAQLGTTAASHLSAAALTYVRPEFLSATAETDPGPFETGGAGGGGVTVTDGTTSVTASSIQMPAGTVSDAGGGVAAVGLFYRRLGPFHVTYQTANLVNPANLGYLVTSLDPGSEIEAWMVSTADWDGSSPGDEFVLGVAASESSAAAVAADYDLGNSFAQADAATALREATFLAGSDNGLASTLAGQMRHRILVVTEANLYAAFYTSGTLTAGAADIYVTVATPAV